MRSASVRSRAARSSIERASVAAGHCKRANLRRDGL
jgi:hypothetical protein